MKVPEKVVVWAFGGKPGNLKAQSSYSTAGRGNGYNMHCGTIDRYVTWGKQRVGINIRLSESMKDHKLHFRLPDGSERDILTGEPVALGIGGGDPFLYYDERTFGINLNWSKSPKAQWLLYDETGEKGRKIATGARLAIVNASVEPDPDFLVYLDRPAGADIGWTSSPDWKEKATGWLTKAKFLTLVRALVV
jgi:hypothetical protein